MNSRLNENQLTNSLKRTKRRRPLKRYGGVFANCKHVAAPFLGIIEAKQAINVVSRANKVNRGHPVSEAKRPSIPGSNKIWDKDTISREPNSG